MKDILSKTLKNGGFITFSLGLLLYVVINLPILINDNGILAFNGDYYMQSIPFTYHIRDCLLSGEVCWDWSAGFGEQFLSSYAYYNLFSPFNLIYLIIPRNSIIYTISFVSALKYGVGSMTAYFFAKRFVKDKHYAVIAGILYMFSSFNAYNIVFHFTDIVTFFPLLLIALEELCINKRRCIFAITVTFMTLLNYYFFLVRLFFVSYIILYDLLIKISKRVSDNFYLLSLKQQSALP